jgi:betaine-aldehyde dehydrogenase
VRGARGEGEAVKIGDPLSRDTKMGPLVTAEHCDRVMQYIEIGRRRRGCCAVARGEGDGWFVEPTIFRDVENTMRIAREEIFGPVLVVIPFDGEEDAVRIANDTLYGLAGAVWTRDVVKGLRVLKQLRAGILWMNTYHPTYNEAPWGGYKQSGFGRELGVWGLENYLETKQININLNEAPLAWY